MYIWTVCIIFLHLPNKMSPFLACVDQLRRQKVYVKVVLVLRTTGGLRVLRGDAPHTPSLSLDASRNGRCLTNFALDLILLVYLLSEKGFPIFLRTLSSLFFTSPTALTYTGLSMVPMGVLTFKTSPVLSV